MVINPYRIEAPALISLSGGRTSAFMLRRILDAFNDDLPNNIYVAFANTGKEREATLRFVYEMEARWKIRVHWLEFVTDLVGNGPQDRFESVGYNSASRLGEPFDRLIARKKSIPSTVTGRWCTQYLKVKVLHDFMEMKGFSLGSYSECIGFRADEYDRVVELPLSKLNKGRKLIFPLAKDGIRKSDIMHFWKQQDFDLDLERGTGNCDHCPFVGFKSRVARAIIDPLGMGWWRQHESKHNLSFGRESFADIEDHIDANPIFSFNEIDREITDSECIGWCGNGG